MSSQSISFQSVKSVGLAHTVYPLTYPLKSSTWWIRHRRLSTSGFDTLQHNPLFSKSTPHNRAAPRLPKAHRIRPRKIHSQGHETRETGLCHSYQSHARRTRRSSWLPHKLEPKDRSGSHIQVKLCPETSPSPRRLFSYQASQRWELGTDTRNAVRLVQGSDEENTILLPSTRTKARQFR
jgi:hypothetical protein